jgi:hypothetical protein
LFKRQADEIAKWQVDEMASCLKGNQIENL